MAADHTESIAGRLIGPYHIATRIGKGGMGEVYLAHDTRLGRRIALKLLSPELTLRAEGVRRFQQEARTASALNHPNILTICPASIGFPTPVASRRNVTELRCTSFHDS